MNLELQDKVVMVTGASRGIGKAICALSFLRDLRNLKTPYKSTTYNVRQNVSQTFHVEH